MILIKDALLINENTEYIASVLINNDKIEKIYTDELIPEALLKDCEVIDAKGMMLLPGVIDDQVHFRDPGLTYKGDLTTESRAAIAGGVTSFMDMPNTKPQTTTIEELDKKYEHAESCAYANYSFYLGATNDNIAELRKINPKEVCGIKVFMGSSTGNMLVDQKKSLEAIFAEAETLVATHCEKEEIIQANLNFYKEKYGDIDIPIQYHPLIRSAEACYRSSSEAAELASKYNTQLHILHLSTAKEVNIFDAVPLEQKRITGEVCVHHLWFCDEDYAKYGSLIKWNPAIKTKEDQIALLEGLKSGKLDVIATDHAPHLLSEKQGGCLKAASGGPLVQHSLQAMLEMCEQGKITKQQVVQLMCHNPAILYRIDRRGYIREGYYADLVLVKKEKYTVDTSNILYKCEWSPFQGQTFSYSVDTVLLNGKTAYKNGKHQDIIGKRLHFCR